MKKSLTGKLPSSRSRITICLPSGLDEALRQEARTSPNGELTPIILRYISLGMSSGQSATTSAKLLPAVIMLGTAIDLVREAGRGDSEPLVKAKEIYGSLLVEVIFIEGVSE